MSELASDLLCRRKISMQVLPRPTHVIDIIICIHFEGERLVKVQHVLRLTEAIKCQFHRAGKFCIPGEQKNLKMVSFIEQHHVFAVAGAA